MNSKLFISPPSCRIVLVLAFFSMLASGFSQSTRGYTLGEVSISPADAPPEASEEYKKLYRKAQNAFISEDWQAASESIRQAIALQPKVAEGYNLLGGIRLKLNEYDRAIEAFHQAASLSEQAKPMAIYNIGEAYFTQRKFQAALDSFQDYREFPATKIQEDVADLKILICQLMLGQTNEATAWLDSVEADAISPLYYFAQASRAFHEEEPETALSYLDSARGIYHPDTNQPFFHSLSTVGWYEKDLTDQAVTLTTPELKGEERLFILQQYLEENTPGEIDQTVLPDFEEEAEATPGN